MEENSKVEHEVIVSVVVRDTHGNQVKVAYGFTPKTTKDKEVAKLGETLCRELYGHYIALHQQLANDRMLQLAGGRERGKNTP